MTFFCRYIFPRWYAGRSIRPCCFSLLHLVSGEPSDSRTLTRVSSVAILNENFVTSQTSVKMEKYDAEHGDASSAEVKPTILAAELQANLDASNPNGVEILSPEDEAMNRRVKRKMDFAMLPLLSLLYLFNGLDKSNVGNAQTQG